MEELEKISIIKKRLEDLKNKLETSSNSFDLLPMEYEEERRKLDEAYNDLLKGNFSIDEDDKYSSILGIVSFGMALISFFIANSILGFFKAILVGVVVFFIIAFVLLSIESKKVKENVIKEIAIENCMKSYEYNSRFFDEVKKLTNIFFNQLLVKNISEERIGSIMNKINSGNYNEKTQLIYEHIGITVCGEKVNGVNVDELGLDSLDLVSRVALATAICEKINNDLKDRIKDINNIDNVKISTSYSYDNYDCYSNCKNASNYCGLYDDYVGDGVWETKVSKTPSRHIADRKKCNKCIGQVIITGINKNYNV